ncbi:hypothetical protein SO802_033651 [Lithocarpus litseifolius]|uniref:ADP-ribosyl cyclase/cyclic ADP-ribose hydrolase n=1 Tax=Lithocarpus litseifolius TaxID=425828 RepID=A0AAW2BDU5_9ROSI
MGVSQSEVLEQKGIFAEALLNGPIHKHTGLTSIRSMAHPVGKENFAPSLSTPTLTYEYEVFVSFYAEDTRKSFTSHLFAALYRKGIHVYRSEFIRIELMKAIETPRIAVVVFSKNYTTSDLCLDELVKIMECKGVQSKRAPYFLPCVSIIEREWKGIFAEALLNGPEDKLNNWKVALRDAANLAGWYLRPLLR